MRTDNNFLKSKEGFLQRNKNGVVYYLASTDLENVSINDIFGDNGSFKGEMSPDSIHSFASEILESEAHFSTSIGKPQIFLKVAELDENSGLDNLFDNESELAAQYTYYNGNDQLFFYKDEDGFRDEMFWMSNFVNGIDSVQNKIYSDLNDAIKHTYKTNKVSEIEWCRLLEDMNGKYEKRNNETPNFYSKKNKSGIAYEYLGVPGISKQAKGIERKRMISGIKDRILVIKFNEKSKSKRNTFIMMSTAIVTTLIAVITIIVTNCK